MRKRTRNGPQLLSRALHTQCTHRHYLTLWGIPVHFGNERNTQFARVILCLESVSYLNSVVYMNDTIDGIKYCLLCNPFQVRVVFIIFIVLIELKVYFHNNSNHVRILIESCLYLCCLEVTLLQDSFAIISIKTNVFLYQNFLCSINLLTD